MKVFLTSFFILISSYSFAQMAPSDYLNMGKQKLTDNQYNQALFYFDKAINLDNGYASAYYLKAQTYYEMGDLTSAITSVDNAITFEKKGSSYLADYYILKGQICAQNKNNPEVHKILNYLQENYPNSPRILASTASISAQNERYHEAIELLSKAITMDPDNSSYYAQRSQLKYKMYEASHGIKVFQDIMNDINMAIALNPDNYNYYEFRSTLYSSDNEPLKALKDYEQMISLNPSGSDAYNKRAVYYMSHDKFDEAITDFQTSINNNPANELSYLYKALCEHNISQYNKAYEDFSKSIKILEAKKETNYWNTSDLTHLGQSYLYRGHTSYSIGHHMNACVDFRTAYEYGIKKAANFYRKYCGL